jgi:C-terminal processing protease CtpA/Prc
MESFKKYHWPWNHPEKWMTQKLEDNVLYVRYGSCSKGVENRFAELIESLEEPLPKAMILDLRGNRGGSTPIRTVRYLISKPVEQYFFKTPCSISYVDARMQAASEERRSKEEITNEIFEDFPEYSPGWYTFSSETIEPERSHYDGPLVILTNRMTSSAAEDLVVILQGNNRATVIGEPTHGSTGQPIFFDLPGGGNVQICTCLSRYPDGRSFVGLGIQPDILAKRTIKGIAQGQDEVLKAAIDYLHSEKILN